MADESTMRNSMEMTQLILYRISFPLFVFSSISLISILQFSVYKSFTSLIKFIPRYFILFDTIINGTVFLISHSDSSLLVYRNMTDLHILILCPMTLPNSFVSFNSFQCGLQGFVCIKSMSSTNSGSFLSFQLESL